MPTAAQSPRPYRSSPSRRPRWGAAVTAAAVLAAGLVPLSGTPASAAPPEDPAALVNTFIGTQNDGNTFPGATTPFGMVQVSPDTGHYVGYDYDDESIRGFSATHPSGVGCGLAGDLPLMPITGELGSTDYAEYASAFDHASEEAEPGYYSVDLDDYGVTAELTATTRTGLQRYTFPAGSDAAVLVNAGQALHQVTDTEVRVVDDRTVEATITGQGFCQETRPYTLYTVTRFDRPFASAGTWQGDAVQPGSAEATGERTGAVLRFDTAERADVVATTAISWVDTDGAYGNLAAEATGGFDETRAATRAAWTERLRQVGVEGGTDEEQRTFYSSLYRTLSSPNTGSDVDGRYRGYDQQVHTAEGFTYYQTWSLWDTYRTQQQLLSLLAPGESRDMAISLLRVDAEGGWLPRWGYGTVETNIMTGDPVTPWLVDAFKQGLLDGYEEEAYAALTKNADGVPPADSQFNGRADNPHYIDRGFVRHDPAASGKPGDYDLQHGGSATLEYALADAALGSMAADLGHDDDADRYFDRAQNYRSVFDPRTGFFRARDADGVFTGPADPAASVGFHEGTAWQYMWLAQQDMPGLIDLIGGTEATSDRLDSFFAYDELVTDPAGTARDVWVNGPYEYYNQDKYNPQNEPNIHAPYAYLWTGEPSKTADVVRAALTLYTDAPNGVTGNDDMGTMSAWHVLSSIGLYPVIPGEDVWGITPSLFDRVTIDLDEAYYPGGDLTVSADREGGAVSDGYVQRAFASGAPLDRTYVTGAQIRDGLDLELSLGAEPSAWGTGVDAAPPAIDSRERALDTLSASVSPTRAVLVEGDAAPATLAVPVVATGAGEVSGTIEVEAPSELAVEAPSEWRVDSAGLPGTADLEVVLTAEDGAALGDYPVTVTVRDDRGAEVSREAVVTLAPEPPFAGLYDSVGIGDPGTAPGDLDGLGFYYPRAGLADAGLVQGAEATVPGTDLRFTLPVLPAGAPDNVSASGETLPAASLAGATRIALVGASVNGDQAGTARLAFDDGSTADVAVALTDWCAGEPRGGDTLVARAAYRGSSTGTDGVACALWATAPIELPAGGTLASITLPDSPDMHVFAVASDAPVAVPLSVDAVARTTQTWPYVNTGLARVRGGEGAVSARVDWGDGRSTRARVSVAPDGDGSIVVGRHVYLRPGSYVVTTTVTDGAGATSTDTGTVVVQRPNWWRRG